MTNSNSIPPSCVYIMDKDRALVPLLQEENQRLRLTQDELEACIQELRQQNAALQFDVRQLRDAQVEARAAQAQLQAELRWRSDISLTVEQLRRQLERLSDLQVKLDEGDGEVGIGDGNDALLGAQTVRIQRLPPKGPDAAADLSILHAFLHSQLPTLLHIFHSQNNYFGHDRPGYRRQIEGLKEEVEKLGRRERAARAEGERGREREAALGARVEGLREEVERYRSLYDRLVARLKHRSESGKSDPHPRDHDVSDDVDADVDDHDDVASTSTRSSMSTARNTHRLLDRASSLAEQLRAASLSQRTRFIETQLPFLQQEMDHVSGRVYVVDVNL